MGGVGGCCVACVAYNVRVCCAVAAAAAAARCCCCCRCSLLLVLLIAHSWLTRGGNQPTAGCDRNLLPPTSARLQGTASCAWQRVLVRCGSLGGALVVGVWHGGPQLCMRPWRLQPEPPALGPLLPLSPPPLLLRQRLKDNIPDAPSMPSTPTAARPRVGCCAVHALASLLHPTTCPATACISLSVPVHPTLHCRPL